MRLSTRIALVAILLNGCAVATQPVDHDKFLAWHKEMIGVPLPPKKGCFKATYPKKDWLDEPCATSSGRRVPVGPGVWMTGNPTAGNPTAVVTSELISTSIGSFDSVEFTSENTATDYSLQLNSQFFDTPACAGAVDPDKCRGWQQFVYHPDNSGRIQYWLLHYGPECPKPNDCRNTTWCFVKPDHCTRFSENGIRPGNEPLSDLIHLSLGATAVSGGQDILTVGIARDGELHALHAFNEDKILSLADDWRAAEFGVFANSKVSQAQAAFDAGATIAVRTRVDNGTTNAPNCVLERFTGEKNNLGLVQPCCTTYGGDKPSIVFWMSNDPNAIPCDGTR